MYWETRTGALRQRRLAIPAPALLITLLLLALAGPALAGGRPLTAVLSGAAEVPGPGDPDGSGSAFVTLNQGLGEVCFDIEVSDIAPVAAAHIHSGTADVAGPVVVNFDVPNNGLSGCVQNVDADLIKAIRQNPSAYYVNVHNADFPPGALRGQLEK